MQNPQHALSSNGSGQNDADIYLEPAVRNQNTPDDIETQGKNVTVRSPSQLWQHQGAIWRTSYQLQAAAEAEAQTANPRQGPESPGEVTEVRVQIVEPAKHEAIQPVSAAAFLVADVVARLFCLTIFWATLVFAIICSNAAVCAALLHRAELSLETTLGLLVALDLALAVLCIAFMARRFNSDTFTWLTSSLFRHPTLVNVEARASLMDRLRDVEAQLQPVMQKAMKAFDKAEDKLRRRAAEAVLLMREDTPATTASEVPGRSPLAPDSFLDAQSTVGSPAAIRSPGHSKASRQRGKKPQGMAKYIREARKVAKVFGKMAKGKAHIPSEQEAPSLRTAGQQVATDAAPVYSV